MKTCDTLIEDIYDVFRNGTTPSEGNLDIIAENVKALLRSRLPEYGQKRKSNLRMSSIGKPSCQIYYDINDAPKETLDPPTLLKFLYGDLIEELLLFLVREAGHTVTDVQKTVVLNGIEGHMDGKINGVITDVKSASPYAFKKFSDGTLIEDDAFGYMKQLAGYVVAENEDKGQFLAMDKVSGKICLLEYSGDLLRTEFPAATIDAHKTMLETNTKPPRAYAAVPDGKSGNMKLSINCSYCAFKETCWSDANNGEGLRTFAYSYGPTFFTEIRKQPRVDEIK